MKSFKNSYEPYIKLLLLLALASLTVFAYNRVLFNFFAADDYCHLAWLASAAKDPRLIWNNFTGPWLGGVVTHFYRPLISIVTLADYLCWGNNATGYHITNLACLLLASFFVFLIFDSMIDLTFGTGESQTATIQKSLFGGKISAVRLWAIAAAGLFALYPIHPEAVSWIIGRVDTISTMLYTGALCYYIRWRQTSLKRYFVVSFIAAILGLLSKEMVITLPAALLAFEIVFGSTISEGNKSEMSPVNLRSIVLRTIKPTLPYWILLGCYATVRLLALGTLFGGYDNSWAVVAGPQLFYNSWLHALRVMLVPVNHDFLGARNWHTVLWESFVIGSAVTLISALSTNKDSRRPFLFLLFWLILALIPVYKIFSINDELQGGRFAYLASAPLSGLFLLGYFYFNAGKIYANALRICALCFVLLSANLLYINNEAWHEDGVQLSAIDRQLGGALKLLPSNSQVLILNLPDSIHGAYACRNALDGILFRIGSKVDPGRCVALNRAQTSFPSGYLKDSIAANMGRILCLWWNPSRLVFTRFDPVGVKSAANTSSSIASKISKWQGASLKDCLSPVPVSGVSYNWLPDGSLSVKCDATRIRPQIDITSLKGRRCWCTDFLCLRVNIPTDSSAGGACGVDLVYANASNPQLGNLNFRANVQLPAKSGTHTLFLALRGDDAWTFGGKIKGCRLLLPDQSQIQIEAVSIIPPDVLLPKLNFPNSDYMHSKGFLYLNHSHPQQEIQFDARGIRDAKSVTVELSRPNVFFDYANSKKQDSTVGDTFALPSTNGEFMLDLNRFKSPGYYALQLRAADTNGKNLGLASDHIVIFVNP